MNGGRGTHDTEVMGFGLLLLLRPGAGPPNLFSCSAIQAMCAAWLSGFTKENADAK